jgi:hypothetical protein
MGPETITVAPAGEPVQNATVDPASKIPVNVGEAVFPMLANVTDVPGIACFALKRTVAIVKVPPV